jgi:ubiquinone/menaquinone biosynthesis C-methylase UbiE
VTRTPPSRRSEGSTSTETNESAESARIREVYERREREISEETYSVTNPGALLMQQQRERFAIRALVDAGFFPLSGTRVLDIGCGSGGWLAAFESWGARQSHLAGIDLSPDRVARAAARLPQADIRTGTGERLPWVDSSFDIVLQSTVFTSILDREAQISVATEMARVLRPTGAILWYDFFRDNPRNPDVRGVSRGDVERLFPGFDVALRRVTLAPPLTRRLARVSWIGVLALERLRVLNTHYVGLVRPSSRGMS